MKVLFFSVTRHQKRYFGALCKNLSMETLLCHYPSRVSLLVRGQSLDDGVVQKILNLKYNEIDPKYKNKRYAAIYKLLLKIQIPFIIRACFYAMETFAPTHFVVWNGKKFHQLLAIEVAKKYNIQIVFFENGLLPNTTTMDFKGVNASNSVPRDIDFYSRLYIDENCNLPTVLTVREAKTVKKVFDNSLPKKYIFVPFQVGYDTQITQHSPWIKDMYVLFEVIQNISLQVDIAFVIKEHPSDKVNTYDSLHDKKNIYFSSRSTQELIEHAEAIVTINSSVGIESLLFHKRVIVLGEAFYAIEGISKSAESTNALKNILVTLDSWNTDKNLIDKFLKYLYCDYLIPDSWKEPSRKHYRKVEKRLLEGNKSMPRIGNG